MDQTTNDFKAADTAISSPLNGEGDAPVKRAIEVGFPIVEINRLAVPERNSFKPIYQMHKWFARRASCVFRAILLGTLKPAIQPDGTPTDLMEEFYKDHSNDPDTNEKVILDPFMGGGTTVVEALRLGCRVIGIDLNPVAWFIVKTETEPVDLDALKAAFDRLAARPVAWNDGRPLKDTLLNLYKTEVAEGIAADPEDRRNLIAGYHLIDERMMKPLSPDGIEPNPNRMGFLDYRGSFVKIRFLSRAVTRF